MLVSKKMCKVLSQWYFPKGNFPSDNFPSGNCPSEQFPKRQFPRGQVWPFEAPQAAMGGRALLLGRNKKPSAAARINLGSCRLGNCLFGNLPIGKIPLGSCILVKILWERTITSKKRAPDKKARGVKLPPLTVNQLLS